MVISYIGHSSFKIRTRLATLVTDPFSKSIGIPFGKVEADIVTVSHEHPDHNNLEGIKNEGAFVITSPGEYEVKEVLISGFKTFHDNVSGKDRGTNNVYLIETEELVLCHLGDLGHELSPRELKNLENTDILFIPVGGFYTIDPKMASKIIKKLEPSYIIPMHYKREGLSESFDKLATFDDFIDELGIEPKKEERLVVTAASLPDEMEVIRLERKN